MIDVCLQSDDPNATIAVILDGLRALVRLHVLCAVCLVIFLQSVVINCHFFLDHFPLVKD